jgi:molybdopterin molybdotransferase
VISFEEALARVLAAARPLGAERVGLDACDGRALAEDVVARIGQPATHLSSMDGYALATADLLAPPHALSVVGESAAGSARAVLEAGTTMRIFTGAALPEGADAVVMQEDVTREGDVARFGTTPAPWAHVRREGDDLRAGAVALARGTRLGPGELALAAACDRASLLVTRRPVVAVLATGNELRAAGDPPRAGSIPDSNSTFVAAAARRNGADARVLPFVSDDEDEATRAVADALDGADLVCSIGGVSVGDHDVMRPAMERAGVSLEFIKVAIKPGKPLVLGKAPGGRVVLGLPGNPASASLTFLLFGVPLLRALAGLRETTPPRYRTRVLGSMSRRPGRMELARAKLGRDADGAATARLLINQASGAVTAFAWADALVVIPVDRERIDDGDELEVIHLADLGLAR